jgi:hypothetical protein
MTLTLSLNDLQPLSSSRDVRISVKDLYPKDTISILHYSHAHLKQSGRTLYATDDVEECEEYQMFCSLSGHVGWMR